jgi:hypothetical protein
MKFGKSTITIDRRLSDLDYFAIDFTTVLKKHTPYVIVSGYVAILLGRARASEDIDIIIPRLDFSTVQSLLKDVRHHGFYCLNAEGDKEIYEYLTEELPVRFAKIHTIIPNIEVNWSKNKFDDIALEKTIQVHLNKKCLTISHLELQVAFKEIVLRSPKDIEDARHIRKVAEGYLDLKAIRKYKVMLRDFYKEK